MGSSKPVVCIVTPGDRSANNGNWRTASRWAAMLRDRCTVILQTRWDGQPADVMVALHAVRSAGSVADFTGRRPGRPVVLMLTGTDVYGDMGASSDARAALDVATRIVVLQENALRVLPAPWRAKAQVIYQSAPAMRTLSKPRGRLDCVAVGHLRAVKDPATLFAAWRLLPPSVTIGLDHFGAPLEAAWGEEAMALQAHDARYRYRGNQPHARVRDAIRAAHLLVITSRAEGGANVIAEAITSGTPVLASRVPGNLGMLGARYPGYFEAGDAAGLARILQRALSDPAWLDRLASHCAARKPLFHPGAEARAVRRLVLGLAAKGRD